MSREKWNYDQATAENARRVLPEIADKYFDQGDKLLGNSHTPGEMHRFRIKTKRFRYTLELFRSLYGPGLEKRLEALQQAQNLLGDINDCATTLDLLKQQYSGRPEDLDKATGYLKRRQRKKVAEFEEYWTTQLRSQKQSYKRYLTRYATGVANQ